MSEQLNLFPPYFAISLKQQLGWCDLTFWLFESQKWMDVYKNTPRPALLLQISIFHVHITHVTFFTSRHINTFSTFSPVIVNTSSHGGENLCVLKWCAFIRECKFTSIAFFYFSPVCIFHIASYQHILNLFPRDRQYTSSRGENLAPEMSSTVKTLTVDTTDDNSKI